MAGETETAVAVLDQMVERWGPFLPSMIIPVIVPGEPFSLEVIAKAEAVLKRRRDRNGPATAEETAEEIDALLVVLDKETRDPRTSLRVTAFVRDQSEREQEYWRRELTG